MSHSFEANEGQYRISSCSVPSYKDAQGSNVAVKLSFWDPSGNSTNAGYPPDSNYTGCDWNAGGMYCLNVGKELYITMIGNQSTDRRTFKVPPTCHAFKPDTNEPSLLIGLSNGEIHLIFPNRKEFCKIFNEEKSIEKTSVTDVSWVPGSPNQFLVSHLSGKLYLYDEKLNPTVSPPTYEPFKKGVGFSVYTCKAKSTRNPLYHWVFGTRVGSNGHSNTQQQNENLSKSSHPGSQLDTSSTARLPIDDLKLESIIDYSPGSSLQSLNEEDSSINQFAFSPCGVYLALVAQDGYLRVVDYHRMELHGYMRSYFAGLLCVDWSPDSRLVVVGGQDDLITVWSMAQRAVICRGQGHRSWISSVRFDPFMCSSTNGLAEFDQTNRSPGFRNRLNSDCNRSRAHSTTIEGTSSSSSQSQEAIVSSSAYRLGSVGQDTMFCLWDLSEDVIRQGALSIRDSSQSLSHTHNPEHPSPSPSLSSDSVLPVTTGSRQLTSPLTHSSGLRMSLFNQSHHHQNKNKSNPPHTISTGTHSRHVGNLFGFLTFSKRKSVTQAAFTDPATLTNPHSPRTTASFGSERIREPQRHLIVQRYAMNASTPSAGEATGGHTSNGDSLSSRTPDSGRPCESTDQNLFGSPLCPRFSDVPVLEPLVCITMLQQRLTDLVFRQNAILVVCQQGQIRSCCRPSRYKESEYSDGATVDDKLFPLDDGKSATAGGEIRGRPVNINSPSIGAHPIRTSPSCTASSIARSQPPPPVASPILRSLGTPASPNTVRAPNYAIPAATAAATANTREGVNGMSKRLGYDPPPSSPNGQLSPRLINGSEASMLSHKLPSHCPPTPPNYPFYGVHMESGATASAADV